MCDLKKSVEELDNVIVQLNKENRELNNENVRLKRENEDLRKEIQDLKDRMEADRKYREVECENVYQEMRDLKLKAEQNM